MPVPTWPALRVALGTSSAAGSVGEEQAAGGWGCSAATDNRPGRGMCTRSEPVSGVPSRKLYKQTLTR